MSEICSGTTIDLDFRERDVLRTMIQEEIPILTDALVRLRHEAHPRLDVVNRLTWTLDALQRIDAKLGGTRI